MNKIEISLKSYSNEEEEIIEFLEEYRYIFEVDISFKDIHTISVYSPNEKFIEFLNDYFD